MPGDIRLQENACKKDRVEEDSPEEGEIQDSSDDENVDLSRSGGFGNNREGIDIIVPINKSVISRKISAISETEGTSRSIVNVTKPVVRIGYPKCVLDVYSSKPSFRDGTDLRSEKENQIGFKRLGNHITEKQRIPLLPEIEVSECPEQLCYRNKKTEPHHRKRQHSSEDRRKNFRSGNIRRRKSKQDESDAFTAPDSDIDKQIQKTRKRLKNDNFNLKTLKSTVKSSSSQATESVSSSEDFSSIEIIKEIVVQKSDNCAPTRSSTQVAVESSLKAIRSNVQRNKVPVKSPSNKNKKCKSIDTDDVDKEALQLRAIALKSALQAKYGRRKLKQSEHDLSIGSNFACNVACESNPVDMDLSLTDEEECVEQIHVNHMVSEVTDVVGPVNEARKVIYPVKNKEVNVEEQQGTDEVEDDDEEVLRAKLLMALSSKQKPLSSQENAQVDVLVNSSVVATNQTLGMESVSLKPAALSATPVPSKLNVQALLAKYASASSVSARKSFLTSYKISKAGNKLVRKDIYKNKKVQKSSTRNFKQIPRETKLKLLVTPSTNLVKGTENRQTMNTAALSSISTIPPTGGRMVIKLGEDTDSEDETSELSPSKNGTSSSMSDTLLKSVDQFLKQVRQDIESKEQPVDATSISDSPVMTSKESFYPVASDGDTPKSNINAMYEKTSSPASPVAHKNSPVNSGFTTQHTEIEPNESSVISSNIRIAQDISGLNQANKPIETLPKQDAPASDICVTSIKPTSASRTNICTTAPQRSTDKTSLQEQATCIPDSNKSSITFDAKAKPSNRTSNLPNTSSTRGPTTPLAVRHLPSSQQMKYHLLKLEIARREELLKLKSRLGKPVSKFTASKREVILQEQPKLEITVRNNPLGAEDTASVRTVRRKSAESNSSAVKITTVIDNTDLQSTNNEAIVETVRLLDKATENDSLSDKNPKEIYDSPNVDTINVICKGSCQKRAVQPSKTVSVKRRKPEHTKQNIAAQLLKLSEEEKRRKLSSTELQLINKRQQMLEQLSTLSNLLQDVEVKQTQIMDAEARVEALKRELARAEAKAEEQRSTIKKLFSQVPGQFPALPGYFFPNFQLQFGWNQQQQQQQRNFSTMDPNTVLCPFALTGICLDDKCKFQHPRPVSSL